MYIGLKIGVILLLISSSPLFAYHSHVNHASIEQKDFPLLEEVEPYIFHPVSTQNRQAQLFFNQGLAFFYAFNQEAAYQSFAQASKMDPHLAMAHWGMALVQSPILSIQTTPDQRAKGYASIQKALELSQNAPQEEKVLIEALAKRFTNQENPDDALLTRAYVQAMQKAANQYPDNLDTITLYASSGLNLYIDQLWQDDGTPQENAKEFILALESVLKRSPGHIGANHYYLHALESSKQPERALPSALQFVNIAPILTHLVHTPSHIFILVGDYSASIAINEQAAAADRAYLKRFPDSQYCRDSLPHNLHFLADSYTMAGNYAGAKKSAEELQEFYVPLFQKQPDMEFFYSTLLLVLIRFEQWQEILQQKQPPSNMAVSNVTWHWARAMAYAGLHQMAAAQAEQKLFQEGLSKLPAHAIYGNSPAKDVLALFATFLDAQLTEGPSSIALLQKAVEMQSALHDAVPFGYQLIMRERLGNALLQDGQYAEAEKVFRKDLEHHPRSGRSLFGLFKSLKEQNKLTDAFWVHQGWVDAWKASDTHP
jgi:tetratricopeptide (TPR) repeat protein